LNLSFEFDFESYRAPKYEPKIEDKIYEKSDNFFKN
jgi:hypothetical protein